MSEYEHDAGCRYGGFSCGWWIRVEGCPEYHQETHIVSDGKCPCGITFPGVGWAKVVTDSEDRPLPPELRVGIGSSVEVHMRGE